jgi:hypothetical protein
MVLKVAGSSPSRVDFSFWLTEFSTAKVAMHQQPIVIECLLCYQGNTLFLFLTHSQKVPAEQGVQ